ncbi:unnamed protein product [Pleuronectes platessa]|uniref:Uncharacterized protein n=1 Tax=Pleuronectes platessa TaxID=8262 RepID=A0A9N7VTB1_PLEPL|nr:unnamed protein product [Pleuronectes platessa]
MISSEISHTACLKPMSQVSSTFYIQDAKDKCPASCVHTVRHEDMPLSKAPYSPNICSLGAVHGRLLSSSLIPVVNYRHPPNPPTPPTPVTNDQRWSVWGSLSVAETQRRTSFLFSLPPSPRSYTTKVYSSPPQLRILSSSPSPSLSFTRSPPPSVYPTRFFQDGMRRQRQVGTDLCARSVSGWVRAASRCAAGEETLVPIREQLQFTVPLLHSHTSPSLPVRIRPEGFHWEIRAVSSSSLLFPPPTNTSLCGSEDLNPLLFPGCDPALHFTARNPTKSPLENDFLEILHAALVRAKRREDAQKCSSKAKGRRRRVRKGSPRAQLQI